MFVLLLLKSEFSIDETSLVLSSISEYEEWCSTIVERELMQRDLVEGVEIAFQQTLREEN